MPVLSARTRRDRGRIELTRNVLDIYQRHRHVWLAPSAPTKRTSVVISCMMLPPQNTALRSCMPTPEVLGLALKIPLSELKRTWRFALQMSAFDQKRTR
jgi:hypothetical protein